ncbi:MAG: hypothetical protein WC438_03530 [Candidatus Pacearchaeota archaeon]
MEINGIRIGSGRQVIPVQSVENRGNYGHGSYDEQRNRRPLVSSRFDFGYDYKGRKWIFRDNENNEVDLKA